MLKKGLGIFCILAVCASCCGLDLVLKSGRILKNVTVLNLQPESFRFQADQFGNGEHIISGTMHYSHLTARSLAHMTAYLAKNFPSMNLTPLRQLTGHPLKYSSSLHVHFTSITQTADGTLGRATAFSMKLLYTTPARYGRIFLKGVYLLNGTDWYGVIRPTGETYRFNGRRYPCFVPVLTP